MLQNLRLSHLVLQTNMQQACKVSYHAFSQSHSEDSGPADL